jgi:hypothetical protein
MRRRAKLSVETILTTVIDQYAARKRGLRDLLDTAKATVVRATETLEKHSHFAAADTEGSKPEHEGSGPGPHYFFCLAMI